VRPSAPPALLVIAKAPVPGRVKTRLCPPLTADGAARLARAALLDTLAVVSRAPAAERVLVLDGELDRRLPLPPGWKVIAQRGAGLGERLAAAFADAGGPALLVGMDTPQLTAELLARGAAALMAPGVGAVLGPSLDGGYWCIGLREPVDGVFAGVPMSRGSTCASQRRRLLRLGLRWTELPALRDVDTVDDAFAVAAQAPASRFAAELSLVLRRRAPAPDRVAV
jgi:uncharacterized protein